MIILLFIAIRLLLISALICFLIILFKNNSFHQTIQTITKGFHAALKRSGFHFPKKNNSIELYKWGIDKHVDICEESLESATRPPMDLVDWMKHGYPKSPDHMQRCNINCNCQLIYVDKIHQPN
ncbi:MAG: hypothetical protein ACI9F2_000534 [Lysobacterales bacterium]|jgi:hypothetical protein